jgi:hypothetical protein
MQYRKTKAHEQHKKQVQQLFDFAVTVCYAIPALQTHLAAVASGTTSLVAPHYFAPQNTAAFLAQNVAVFETRLSSHLYLSLFSFFESFVNEVVEEMLAFHGGAKEFIAIAQRREKARVTTVHSQSIQNSVGKLRSHKKGKEQKYAKFSALLESQGYRFPSERMSSYGVRMLVEQHKNLKAHAIPDLLEHGLLLPLAVSEKRQYDQIRTKRNAIAHGNSPTLGLADVRHANDFFRDMTFRINSHLLEHFFVVERYAK